MRHYSEPPAFDGDNADVEIQELKNSLNWSGEEPRIKKGWKLNIYLTRRRYYSRKEGIKLRTESEWE